MFYNHLKIAFRSLWRKKSFTIINMLGLAIGIAASLVIFVVIRHELSFDQYHRQANNVYRMTTSYVFRSNGEVESRKAAVPWPLPDVLRRDYPQLDAAGVIWPLGKGQIYVPQSGKEAEKRFIEKDGLSWVEPEIFRMFDFTWLAGGPQELAAPNTAVLDKSKAIAYFGSTENAMGKTIQLFSFRIPLKIVGVFDNVPGNTDVPVKVGGSLITLRKAIGREPGTNEDWVNVNPNYVCFVALKEGQQPAAFETQLKGLVKQKYNEDGRGTRAVSVLGLQPLRTMHLDKTHSLPFPGSRIDKKELWSMALIGCFLVLVACVNFVNLATAQSSGRAREIGVRKVLGSDRTQLRLQFMYETAIVTFSSLCIAFILAAICTPWLGQMINRQLVFFHPSLFLFLLLTGVAVTFLAGFYPAVVISGFNPLAALKNSITARSVGGISLRRGLVVFQFVIAQLLVICTLVVLEQMKFFRERPMGFDKASTVLINLPSDSLLNLRYAHLQTRMAAIPGVSGTSLCLEGPSATWDVSSSMTFNNRPEKEPFVVVNQYADTGYYNTFQLQFVAGRKPAPADTIRELVVNEMLLKKLNVPTPAEALGKQIQFGEGGMGEIVGVIKDYSNQSLREEVPPLLLATQRGNYEHLALRIKPADMETVLPVVQKVFAEVYPTYMFDLTYVDQRIQNYYASEALISLLFRIFAGLAIFISCLGLYGLVSFMAVQKTKEVGIRKVLGASVQSIVLLFSREFTILIAIAFVIAAPLAYFFMQEWLSGFRFHVQIGWMVFVLAMLFSVVIGWVTVGYKAVQAALVNPVRSLKAE